MKTATIVIVSVIVAVSASAVAFAGGVFGSSDSGASTAGSGYRGGDDKGATVPNDPLFEVQRPYFEKMNVLESWQISQGDSSVVIGVVDLGFDFYHPDMEGKLKPGFYADNAYHTETSEVVAHGTLVSGIMVAETHNGIGVAGLAPGCSVLTASVGVIEHTLIKLKKEFEVDHPEATPQDWQIEMFKRIPQVQKFGQDWTGFIAASSADAVRYLVDHGVKVINSSNYYDLAIIKQGAGKKAVETLNNAFEYAAANDVVIVIGAGNVSKEVTDYPGDSTNVIVAGAVMLNDTRWEQTVDYMEQEIKQGSCYGPRLTVMAPIQDMVVCLPHEERFYGSDAGPMGSSEGTFVAAYDTLETGGTSSAAPIVTSLVALVRSARPDLSAEDVVQIIKQGAVDIGPPGRDSRHGWGRVDFLKTLKLAETWGEE